MEGVQDGDVVTDCGAAASATVAVGEIGVGEGDGEAGVVDGRDRVVVAVETEDGLVVVVAEDGQAGVAAVRARLVVLRRGLRLCSDVEMERVLDDEMAAGGRLGLARGAAVGVTGRIAMGGSGGEEDDKQGEDVSVAVAAEGRHG